MYIYSLGQIAIKNEYELVPPKANKTNNPEHNIRNKINCVRYLYHTSVQD